MKIPPLAFHCTLTKLKPSSTKNPDGRWSSESIREFEEIIYDGIIIGSVYSIVDDLVSFVLYKCDENNLLELTNVNEKMIDEGFAEICQESQTSKVNYTE